jgi:hypothetical protein
MPLTFSADGTRWSMAVIEADAAQRIESGLMFSSQDGERRFLPLSGAGMPTPEALNAMSNAELGALAARALPLS